MRIALIHHPLGHKIFSENIQVVDEEFALAPPIILAYVAAILEKAGHQVILIDANVLKLTPQKTLKIIKEFNPEIIGFRADNYWFHRVVDWATFFKNNTDAKILVGGIQITLYPEESLFYTCFDYGIAGEAIKSLPQLISAVEKQKSIKKIEGLIFRENGNIVYNQPSEKSITFDNYPFPSRHLLPNHMYHSFTSQRKNFTIMLTVTGCPYICNFCAINRLSYRERSINLVIEEVEECYEQYHVREIDFFDASFFCNRERSLQLFNEILSREIKIDWSCRSRVDNVDDELLKMAAKAGCKKIYYGIETDSQKVLEQTNKHISKDQIINAINLSKKYGIETLGFFMIGNPGETKKTALSSIAFAKKLKLDFVQVCRTIAKPNTGLHDVSKKKTGVDHWREYTLNRKIEDHFPLPETSLTEEEIYSHVRKFYFDFYFRPTIIIRRIIHLKSFSEFVKYVKTALKLIFYHFFRFKNNHYKEEPL